MQYNIKTVYLPSKIWFTSNYYYTYEEPWRSHNLILNPTLTFFDLAVRYFLFNEIMLTTKYKKHNQEDLMSSLTNEHPQIIKMSRRQNSYK